MEKSPIGEKEFVINLNAGRWRRIALALPADIALLMGFLALNLIVCAWVRLAFLFVFRDFYAGEPVGVLLSAFLHGLRFDFATACFLMVPAFSAVLFTIWRRKLWLWLPSILLLVPFLISLPIYFADFAYYGESGRRLSYEIFRLGNDFNSIFQMVLHYKISLVVFLSLAMAITFSWWKITLSFTRRDKGNLAISHRISWLFIFAVVFVLGIRGGIQSKPLRPSFAYLGGKPSLAQLSLNPIYTVFYALKKGDVNIVQLIPADEATRRVQDLVKGSQMSFQDPAYPLFQSSKQDAPLDSRHPNIVVMVLESWSGKYVGSVGGIKGITPNFDDLASQGALFTNFYAIGHRSTDGITAGCCSIPTYQDLQIIGTSLEQNRFLCLADILGRSGYDSFFLHGAKTGSFGLNAFSKVAGFKRYIGKEDFDLGANEADATWGVYDYVALNRLNVELREAQKPVFAVWFSLTSHSPYELPSEKYRVTPETEPDHELLDTLKYSDGAIGRFFQQARKELYFENTIFVLFADHTAGSILKGTRERQHIPCLVYAPALLKPKRVDVIGSQLDILPTILELTGNKTSVTTFGRSLLDEDSVRRYAFVDQGGHYGWLNDQFTLLASAQGDVIGLYDSNNDPYEQVNMANSFAELLSVMRRDLFSFVQVSKKLVRDNQLVPREIP